MSTYFYMACETHKVRTKDIVVVGRSVGDHLDNHNEFCKFLMKHQHHLGCLLKFFSEYNEELYEYPTEVSNDQAR